MAAAFSCLAAPKVHPSAAFDLAEPVLASMPPDTFLGRPFDEPAARAMLELAQSRATDPAAAANHNRAVWMDDPDLLASLSSITSPTSIVPGDQDPVYPLGHGEALAAAIPGAVLHVVPGMGHVLTSPGLPEEVADLIRL